MYDRFRSLIARDWYAVKLMQMCMGSNGWNKRPQYIGSCRGIWDEFPHDVERRSYGAIDVPYADRNAVDSLLLQLFHEASEGGSA
jgi:hypothetical protein